MKRISLVFLLIALFSALISGQTTEEKRPGPPKSGQNEIDKSADIPPGFKSDGCTMFPDGNYRDCCVAHDLDYYNGGTRKERRASDKRLYRCVKSKKKGWRNKFRASIMYIGVRLGGVPCLPTPFRWGFGKKKIEKARKKAAREKKIENLEQKKEKKGESKN
jgi:hypothetical protein